MSSEENTRTRILESTWRLMEQRKGLGVRMSDIAKNAGISRQALYLHFPSRAELMIATAIYVDEVKRLNERLVAFEKASTGVELLETLVEVWGNYIPEVYGIAKALLNARDSDEAANAAWIDRMACLYDACQSVIEALEREDTLTPDWTRQEAIELLSTLMSIQNWEQLIFERGWSNKQYVDRMKVTLKRIFIDPQKTQK
jgi:AcrR family transcriptional regulator